MSCTVRQTTPPWKKASPACQGSVSPVPMPPRMTWQDQPPDSARDVSGENHRYGSRHSPSDNPWHLSRTYVFPSMLHDRRKPKNSSLNLSDTSGTLPQSAGESMRMSPASPEETGKAHVTGWCRTFEHLSGILRIPGKFRTLPREPCFVFPVNRRAALVFCERGGLTPAVCGMKCPCHVLRRKGRAPL